MFVWYEIGYLKRWSLFFLFCVLFFSNCLFMYFVVFGGVFLYFLFLIGIGFVILICILFERERIVLIGVIIKYNVNIVEVCLVL